MDRDNSYYPLYDNAQKAARYAVHKAEPGDRGEPLLLSSPDQGKPA
jgi:hypothetical protein